MLPSMLPPSDAIPDCELPSPDLPCPFCSFLQQQQPSTRSSPQRTTQNLRTPSSKSPLLLPSCLTPSPGHPFASAHWTVCHCRPTNNPCLTSFQTAIASIPTTIVLWPTGNVTIDQTALLISLLGTLINPVVHVHVMKIAYPRRYNSSFSRARRPS